MVSNLFLSLMEGFCRWNVTKKTGVGGTLYSKYLLYIFNSANHLRECIFLMKEEKHNSIHYYLLYLYNFHMCTVDYKVTKLIFLFTWSFYNLVAIRLLHTYSLSIRNKICRILTIWYFNWWKFWFFFLITFICWIETYAPTLSSN